MEGQIADDDVFSGEPVPLWLEEQFWSEDEIAEMAEVAREDEKEEEEMGFEGGIANIEEVAYEEEEEIPVAEHSEEALALALLAGSALAIFLVGYLNRRRGSNAERRGARI